MLQRTAQPCWFMSAPRCVFSYNQRAGSIDGGMGSAHVNVYGYGLARETTVGASLSYCLWSNQSEYSHFPAFPPFEADGHGRFTSTTTAFSTAHDPQF